MGFFSKPAQPKRDPVPTRDCTAKGHCDHLSEEDVEVDSDLHPGCVVDSDVYTCCQCKRERYDETGEARWADGPEY